MMAFNFPVFYIGESNRYVGYGEECTLWYNFSNDIEEIEVTTYELDLVISIQSNTISDRWGGHLFGYEELEDFVQGDEWLSIQREKNLARIMEDIGI